MSVPKNLEKVPAQVSTQIHHYELYIFKAKQIFSLYKLINCLLGILLLV